MENNELLKLNKGITKEKNILEDQNKKLYEINEKLSETEKNLKISEKYISGFKSFFGFFPKLFSRNKTNTDKEIAYTSKEEKIDNIIEEDDLLKKNATELRDMIKLSLKETEIIYKKVNGNENKLKKLNKESNEIIKS